MESEILSNLLTFSGITTKVRAMQKNLFTPSQYKEFALFQSVSEAVMYLKKHPSYGSIFSDIDEANLHRGEIERRFKMSLHNDFLKIHRFCNVNQRKFLNLYFLRYETNLLKTCMRYVFGNKEEHANISDITALFQPYSKIPYQQLLTSLNIEEFIENLKGTDYYNPLSRLTGVPHPSLFDYESILDLYYFKRVWKYAGKYLKGKALASIQKSYGSKIDLLNIQWIYRSHKYYHMNYADIYALIIPIQYKLRKTDIVNMVEASTLDDFNYALKNCYYAKIYQPQLSINEDLEHLYLTILNKIHQTDSRKNPYSISIINSYLYQKEQEIDKLTTAIECIRYGLNETEKLSFVSVNSSTI